MAVQQSQAKEDKWHVLASGCWDLKLQWVSVNRRSKLAPSLWNQYMLSDSRPDSCFTRLSDVLTDSQDPTARTLTWTLLDTPASALAAEAGVLNEDQRSF